MSNGHCPWMNIQSASNLFPIRLVSAPFQFKRAKGYFELKRSKTAARRRLFMLCFCRTCHDALWFALITTHFAVQTDLLSPTSSFFRDGKKTSKRRTTQDYETMRLEAIFKALQRSRLHKNEHDLSFTRMWIVGPHFKLETNQSSTKARLWS